MSTFIIAAAVLLGLLVGSFLNVVIYRLPVTLKKQWRRTAKEYLEIELDDADKQRFNIMYPPSRCPTCGSGVKAWQNIPIISYIFLRGRCHSCRTPISLRYPAIELLTGIMFGIVAWRYGFTPLTAGGLIFTALLIAMTFIDADTQLLPDELTLPLMWLGLLGNWYYGWISLHSAVIGAAAGYMSLWSLYQIHKLITKREGMGGGDFKLLAALGAWLGVASLPVIALMASIVGLVAALIMRVAKAQPIAFGPALAIAGWIIFVAHEPVMNGVAWWLNKSGF